MLEAVHKVLRWSRRLAHVPRWVVTPTIIKQSVAEHCFHAARTAQWLILVHEHATGKVCPVADELAILKKCLDHDDHEAADGDSPSPSKPKKDYSVYSEVEVFVKVCDLMEAYLFITEDAMMGNRRVVDVERDLYDRLVAVWPHFTFMGEPTPFKMHELLNKLLDNVFAAHPALER